MLSITFPNLKKKYITEIYACRKLEIQTNDEAVKDMMEYIELGLYVTLKNGYISFENGVYSLNLRNGDKYIKSKNEVYDLLLGDLNK